MTKYGPLSDRTRAVRAILQDAARACAETPRLSDMARDLTAQGFDASEYLVSCDIKRLALSKLIEVFGKGPVRIYGIPNTLLRTTSRPVPERRFPLSEAGRAAITAANSARLARESGWPKPTPESIAAYDAAVAAKPFAVGDRTNPDPSGWNPKRMYVASHSECGSAAAMCLE